MTNWSGTCSMVEQLQIPTIQPPRDARINKYLRLVQRKKELRKLQYNINRRMSEFVPVLNKVRTIVERMKKYQSNTVCNQIVKEIIKSFTRPIKKIHRSLNLLRNRTN
jgi:Zn-dependent oligopeptidase